MVQQKLLDFMQRELCSSCRQRLIDAIGDLLTDNQVLEIPAAS
jgi:hypothetical protein